MVDYSAWRDIELSDDENDTHPNVDTPSLFRFRHQARLQRMAQKEQAKKNFERRKTENKLQMKEIVEKERKDGADNDDKELNKRLEQLALEEKELEEEEEKWKLRERKEKWNVDTISKEIWSKTFLSKPELKTPKMSMQEKTSSYIEFVREYDEKMHEYVQITNWEECKKLLKDNPDMVSDNGFFYLLLLGIELIIDEKESELDNVGKHAIALNHAHTLIQSKHNEPSKCINAVFNRLQYIHVDKHYEEEFGKEVDSFKSRVRNRAQIRLEEAIKAIEEEERSKRLGPGGLDPVEVFESLPQSLQECFAAKNIPLLHKAISEMDTEEAAYHIQRCIDSGMWIPDINKA